MSSKNYTTGKEAIEALNTPENPDDRTHDQIRVVFHIKRRMQERGLTQSQLSEMTGVRQATISQLSRGYIERLHIPTLEKIANALKITDINQLMSLDLESEIMNMANPYDVSFGDKPEN